MKFSNRRRIFTCTLPAMIVTAAAPMLAGCVSSSFEDAVPQAALAQPASPVPAAGSGPRLTGTYPDLNVAPQVAAEQISDDERQALVEELAGARNRASPNALAGNPQSDGRNLRRLAQSHAEQKLQEIESGE